MHCVGIRRAPRPIEEDPVPGSENLLKIRRPSATGPYAAYRDQIGLVSIFNN